MNTTEKISTESKNGFNISLEDNNEFLNAALEIGKQLAANALWHKNRCNWIGESLEGTKSGFRIVNRSFDMELYNGISGIALFLSKLYTATLDKVILHTLNGALNTILWQLDSKILTLSYGTYNGSLGIAWALHQIGEDLDNAELKEHAFALLKKINKTEPKPEQLDIIDGPAGAILSLLKIWKVDQEDWILDMAKKCGDFLLNAANKADLEWSWPSAFSAMDLTGFSHGAGGISTALLELSTVTQDNRYSEAAFKGYNYEKKWFVKEQANWADLREYKGDGKFACSMAWCHGAPGFVLSRLKAYQLSANMGYWEEAQVALETTYKNVVQSMANNSTLRANFSICHGLAGNADILLEAGHKCSHQTFIEIANQVGRLGIELYANNGLSWPSGINDPSGLTLGQGETPGLMLGMAGTGYFYLRLALGEKIPSLLY